MYIMDADIQSYESINHQAATIELLSCSEQIEAASRWQCLEQSISNTGLTNSWPWIKVWLDNYGDTVQPTFAFGKLGNQLIGATLITKAVHRIRGIPIPSVHLGTAGEPEKETTRVEYNRLLVAAENLDAFAAGLIDTLQRRFCWSELRLDGFVPDHAVALISAGVDAGLHFKREERKSPAFDFQQAADEGYQDVISALGNHTRRNIRRSLRLFDTNFGQRRIEWAETPEQAKDILRELIALHQHRWECVGIAGAFQSGRVRRYHENLIDALSLWPQGSLIVFRLKQGQTTLGCLFTFVEGGHVLGYKAGFPLFDDNRLNPGLVTNAICMEECKRRGLLKYDFLAGEVLYKGQLSNTEGVLIWASAQRGPRMWLLDKAHPPFQLARDIMRRSAVFAFCKRKTAGKDST
jgi:Acetyltransferase (GNAT) domain